MSVRLNKVLKEFNIGLQTAVECLAKKGHNVESDLNTKISDEQYEVIRDAYGTDKSQKKAAEDLSSKRATEKKATQPKPAQIEEIKTVLPEQPQFKTVGKVDLDSLKPKAQKVAKPKVDKAAEEPKAEPVITDKPELTEKQAEVKQPEPQAEAPVVSEVPQEEPKKQGSEIFRVAETPTIEGPKVLGSIDLGSINENTRPKKKSKEERKKERDEKLRQQHAATGNKKKRNRIQPNKVDVNAEAKRVTDDGRDRNAAADRGGKQGRNKRGKGNAALINKNSVSDEDVAKEVKKTLARLQGKKAFASGAKYRREKR